MNAGRILDVSAGSGEEYDEAISAAVSALKDGRLAVFPTDTVYGIAADAFAVDAVGALLIAKGRGRDYPVPVLVGDAKVLPGLVTVPPDSALALSAAFWPGPLTIIVDYSRSLAWDLGDTGGTVAVRVPHHPVALDILRQTGPLAVSSANRHGQPPGASAALAHEQLGDAVQIYLEAGRTGGAEPSTIVDCTGAAPVIVRPGALSLAQLQSVVPQAISAT